MPGRMRKLRRRRKKVARRVPLKPIREFFGESPELAEIFVRVHRHLMNLIPSVRFEAKGKLMYYTEAAERRHFVAVTRKKGKIVLWTGGNALPGVAPDPRHPAWGSIWPKDQGQIPAIKAALSMSLDCFLFAVASGRPVSWGDS